MRRNNLSESIDRSGIPLIESEISVKFDHNGRPAVAVFEVSGGYQDKSMSRDFPPEHVDPEIENIGLYYEDDESPIYAKDVHEFDKLEGYAIEQYWDELQRGD